MSANKLISIAVPCFNEELNVELTYNKLKKITDQNPKYQYEFIFVDNGSLDKTKEIIKKLTSIDKRVSGIFLSRNFGPEASGQAALDYSSGDAFIPYECDLQDPPELILKFITQWENGFDIVIGVRDKTDDSLLMTQVRKLFYKVFRTISNINIPVNVGSFSLIDRKVVNALSQLPEKYRLFRGLRAWVGFKTTYIKYQRRQRSRGKSSYNFFDYIKHAERGIFGFSYLILDLMVYFSFVLVLFSFLSIFVYTLFSLIYGNPIKGSITILVSIVFFGGIQLLAISIIGKYIQVIVEETKNRPVYIIAETINTKK